MKKTVFVLSLLSGAAMFPGITVALGNPTYSHTSGLNPVSQFVDMSKSFKTAAVCFLGVGDCTPEVSYDADDDYTVDSANRCKNEGFTKTSCALPTYPAGQCTYNPNYYASCDEDRPRACRESGFSTAACSEGQVQDTACPYDSSYQKCKCNPCSGFTYTYAEANAQGYVQDGSCNSCGTLKYKRKINPCSGYSSCECGGASGASSCYSGSTQKFSTCKNCDPCAGYYDCGGSWQYCTGSKCSADSSRCSNYCASDYFPNSCSSSSYCNGIYRSGYCSGSCNEPAPTPPPSGESCFFNGGYYHGFCCDNVGSYCGGFSSCYNHFGGGSSNAMKDPNCSNVISECNRCGGRLTYNGCGNYGYDTMLTCSF